MKKNINNKLVLCMLAMTLCLTGGIVGCGNNDNKDTSSKSSNQSENQENASVQDETLEFDDIELNEFIEEDIDMEQIIIGARTEVETPMTLHNTALGVSMDLPVGWWISSIDNTNFHQSTKVTESKDTMQKYQVNDERSLVNMVEIANYDSRVSEDDYFALLYNGEVYTNGISMDDYILDLKSRITGGDPTGIAFDADEYIEINGAEYFSFGFTDEFNEPNGVYRFYIIEDEGYFMAFTFYHYVTHEKGQEMIEDFMKNNVTMSK